jgi:putative ABC transport system substrate-binding protein
MTLRYQVSAGAVTALGVTVQPLGVGEPDDFDHAFTAMDLNPPDAIFMVTDPFTVLNRGRVFDYAVGCQRFTRTILMFVPEDTCPTARI